MFPNFLRLASNAIDQQEIVATYRNHSPLESSWPYRPLSFIYLLNTNADVIHPIADSLQIFHRCAVSLFIAPAFDSVVSCQFAKQPFYMCKENKF